MEKLTKKLIDRLPLDVTEITLSVEKYIPYSHSKKDGHATRSLPGIRYAGKVIPDPDFGGSEFDGIFFCRPRFSMSGVRRAHIVASELKGYLESFGAQVHYNGQK